MQGKIALEEHMATEYTVDDSAMFMPDVWPDLRRRLLDIHDERVAEMDKFGVEFSILSLNAVTIQGMLDTKQAIEVSRRANDDLAAAVSKMPDRFAAFAALPMQDADAAAEELTRAVNDLGMKGALVNGFTQRDVEDSAIYYDIAEYNSFWDTVAELNVPFYLHPRTQVKPRMQPYEGHNWLVAPIWGFARETSIHALRLIGSGLFDRHPGIEIILGHMGERIPYDLWRIDHRIKKAGADYSCKHPVRHYMQNNFYVTTSGNFSDPTLHCAIAELGVDRVMFSVDYPFEDHVDAADWFDNTELDEKVRREIGRDNAVRLFDLRLG